MRILILNWRCPSNPRAGGAEAFTHQIAARLVKLGDEVQWFSADFPGARSTEEIDGIRIVRGGRQWSVHVQAYARYRRANSATFDAVIDEVNTIPFFTPLWAQIPSFMLIHQLAREVWWHESRFPLSLVGYAAEPIYLRAYRRTPVFTVSHSTEMDLRRLGFEGEITIIPEGLEAITQSPVAKNERPTLLYVGRISPSKRVDDTIRAFGLFHADVPNAQLLIVGDGSSKYLSHLKRLARKLGVGDSVLFLGRVETAQKHRLMAAAHILLVASVREGWGLVVLEANAVGTPAVVYDVAGLRDSVNDGLTGLVVRPSPAEMARAIARLWTDRGLLRRLSIAAQVQSNKFSYDIATAVLRRSIDRYSYSRRSRSIHDSPTYMEN